jgi:hypothetical protein
MRHLIVAIAAFLTACFSVYGRVQEPTGVDATKEVDVWSHGSVLRLHGVTMLLDSITGIPSDIPLDCDSCRMGIPLSEVDSMFTQRESVLGEAVFGTTGGLLLFYLLARTH